MPPCPVSRPLKRMLNPGNTAPASSGGLSRRTLRFCEQDRAGSAAKSRSYGWPGMAWALDQISGRIGRPLGLKRPSWLKTSSFDKEFMLVPGKVDELDMPGVRRIL